jgi:hypothetical protein
MIYCCFFSMKVWRLAFLSGFVTGQNHTDPFTSASDNFS